MNRPAHRTFVIASPCPPCGKLAPSYSAPRVLANGWPHQSDPTQAAHCIRFFFAMSSGFFLMDKIGDGRFRRSEKRPKLQQHTRLPREEWLKSRKECPESKIRPSEA